MYSRLHACVLTRQVVLTGTFVGWSLENALPLTRLPGTQEFVIPLSSIPTGRHQVRQNKKRQMTGDDIDHPAGTLRMTTGASVQPVST